MTTLEHDIIIVFIVSGIAYHFLGIVDHIRWWNGSDENGKPK